MSNVLSITRHCKTVVAGWLLLVIPLVAVAQERPIQFKGQVSLTSDAPLELIKASSRSLIGSIDPSNNQFAFLLRVKTLTGFNSGLQQEHFNEKYMESEKFPNASFSGKIIDPINLSANGVYEVRAKGKLEIHGQSQVRIIKCTLTVRDGSLSVASEFTVPLVDHNIIIPRIVSEKIASEIDINLSASTH